MNHLKEKTNKKETRDTKIEQTGQRVTRKKKIKAKTLSKQERKREAKRTMKEETTTK